MFYWLVKIIFFLPLRLVYPTIVRGKKNIVDGRMILAPNHQTLNDPIIIFSEMNKRFSYMAKAPLFEKQPLKWILYHLGAYPVHNKANDITAVKTTLRLLKDDKRVVIFPEGMRIKSDVSNEIKHGVANFALKTKTPIVPACFMRFTNAFTLNTLVIGKPIYLHEMEEFSGPINHETLDAAGKIISESIYALKDEFVAGKIEAASHFYDKQIADMYYEMYRKSSHTSRKRYDKVAQPFIEDIKHIEELKAKKIAKIKKKYSVA